jgi:hypothetical protein
MVRAQLVWLGMLALSASACGKGDHERGADLARLFGGGSAGQGTPAQGAEHDATDDESSAPPETTATKKNPAVMPSMAKPVAAADSGGGTRTQSDAAMSGTPRAMTTPEASGTGGSEAPATAQPENNGGAPASVDPPAQSGCDPGFVAVQGLCLCDANGTFALHASIPVSMKATAPIEALSDTIDLWALVHQKLDAQGTLSFAATLCGQTTPDICAAAQTPVIPSPEAFAQYIPVEAWDRSENSAAEVQLSFLDGVAGAEFVTPALAFLQGVSLADPLGAMPSSRKDIADGPDFDGSATNAARWIDMDGDGKPGLTTKIVGPSGAAATATSGPPRTYAATSSVCPRSDAQAARSPYSYLPFAQGIGVKRVKSLYSAQRLVVELHGTLESCDRSSGMLTGPSGGKLKIEGVLGGCSMVNGSSESDCTSSMLDAASSMGGGSPSAAMTPGIGTFVLTRVANEATCSDARALSD